jgi:hypothetical protein
MADVLRLGARPRCPIVERSATGTSSHKWETYRWLEKGPSASLLARHVSQRIRSSLAPSIQTLFKPNRRADEALADFLRCSLLTYRISVCSSLGASKIGQIADGGMSLTYETMY